MNKSKNGKLNIGSLLDKSLDLDKVPVEFEYDLPDGSFEEPIEEKLAFFPSNDDIVLDANEEVESIDEMIANADSVDDLEYYAVDSVQNDSNEFDEVSMTYGSDSLDPEEFVSYEDGINKEATYTDELDKDVETFISKSINGENFAKNFDLPETLLDDIKKDSEVTTAEDIDKLLGGGASEANLVKELPIFESAAERILRQQQEKQESEKNASPFSTPNKEDNKWFTQDLSEPKNLTYGVSTEEGLINSEGNASTGLSNAVDASMQEKVLCETCEMENFEKGLINSEGNVSTGLSSEVDASMQEEVLGDTCEMENFEEGLQNSEGEFPVDDNLPEFLKTYIDKDLEKEKIETEKQVESTTAGEEKMEENKVNDNEIEKSNVSKEVASVIVPPVTAENGTDTESKVLEDTEETLEDKNDEQTIVVNASNEKEVDNIISEQIKKTVNNKINKPQKDGVVRVCVDDGSVICDVCGHLNKKASGVCEMCSNYLKVRR